MTSAMSITQPTGFQAAATTAGIKQSGAADLALVVNCGPRFDAAAVFTRNKVCAAPVKLTRDVVADGTVRAVVINSGNANACTGAQGMEDARSMQSGIAQALGCAADEVAVASTGLIGEPMPMDRISAALGPLTAGLDDAPAAGEAFAHAIMTTDTVAKSVAHTAPAGFHVGGAAKGVGMMAPSLATMLCVLTTDAVVDAQVLQAALSEAVDQTFNTLDIDGTTSTNDTVVIMASGASGVAATPAQMNAAVLEVCQELAALMQADAEGVTKRVRVSVTGTTDDDHALRAARTVARDNLFKCAMFGSDPNWGRVLAAVGMAPADMDPEGISVSFNGHPVCRDSAGVPGAREVDLSGPEIAVDIDLGLRRPGRATVRTTDLSHAYVEINSAYST